MSRARGSSAGAAIKMAASTRRFFFARFFVVVVVVVVVVAVVVAVVALHRESVHPTSGLYQIGFRQRKQKKISSVVLWFFFSLLVAVSKEVNKKLWGEFFLIRFSQGHSTATRANRLILR